MARNIIETRLVIRAETAQAMAQIRAFADKFKELKAQRGTSKALIDPTPLKQATTQLAAMRGEASQVGRLLQGAFAAAGLGVGLSALTRMSDAYSGMTARLRGATAGQAEFNEALAAARSLSSTYEQGLEGVARLVTKTYSAIKPLGGTLKDATATTEALLASLKKDGAGAEAAASAVLQFSQALASGVLRGDEFNAITEAAPSLLDALAEGLQRPRSELKGLGEQGRLTTDQIVAGLARTLPQLRETARAIPPTIGGGFTVLNNAVSEFIGKSAQTSGAARLISDSLKTAAVNADALAVAVGVLGGGALLAGLGRLAGGIGSVIAASAGVGGAMTSLLALFGGPVGVIAVLGAATTAWALLSQSKRRAAESDVQAMTAEREALMREIQQLEERAKTARGFFDREAFDARVLRDTVRSLDAKIAAAQARARAAADAAPKGGAAPNLDDPSGLDRLRKEYPLVKEIAGKFEEDRQALIAASEKAVARLRDNGREAEAQALEKSTAQRLRLIDQAEKAAMAKSAPVATRLAQFRAAYDAQLELQRDAIARERALNDRSFEDGTRDLQTYLVERSTLEAKAFDADMTRMSSELEDRRRVLDTNRRRAEAGGDPNAAEAAREAVFAETQAIAKLEADIALRKREQAAEAASVLRDATRLGEELRAQSDDISRRLARAEGEDLTREQLRAEVADRYKDELARLRQLGGDDKPLLRLIDSEATRLELEQVERQVSRMQADLAIKEQAIQANLAAGKITNEEAEVQTLDLRRRQIPVLDAIIERMAALARTPEEKQRVEQLRVQFKTLTDLRLELEKTARSAGISAITTALNDIATGAKTGKAALLDMVGGFARAMLDVLNRRLAERLVDSFVQAASNGGFGNLLLSGLQAIGSFFGFQFHSGGFAGRPTTRRQIDPAAAAAAIAYGPRFHNGLRSNELLAVLEDDETVLTAEQTKRVASFARSGKLVEANTTIHIKGGGSEESGRRAGSDLARTIESAVDVWAANNMRPGGLLHNLKNS